MLQKKKFNSQLHFPLAHVCCSDDVLCLNEFSVLQELVLESELGLLALAPGPFVVKVDIRSLLIVLCDRLRLFVPLEPCQVLFVESPRLLLQLTCCQVSRCSKVSKTFVRIREIKTKDQYGRVLERK